MIDFRPDETQELLRQTVATFAREELRPRARQAESLRKIPEEILTRYRELGLALDEYPEELGGGGLDILTILIAWEELGAGDLGIASSLPRPGPAGWILYRLNHPRLGDLLNQLLHRGGRGLLLFTPWMIEEEWEPSLLPLAYKKLPHGYHLQGEYPLAFGVENVVFAVAFARGERESDPILAFLLEEGEILPGPRKELCGAEVACVAPVTVSAEIPEDRLLHGDIRSALKEALLRERLRTAAMILGTTRSAWEEAVEYAQVREAFGKKIAEFQAIAFMLANAAIDIEGSRSLLWQAAWSLKEGKKDAERIATEAIIHTYLCADRVTTDAVQVFGGNGFVQDYPVEKFMRDVRTVSVIYGSRPYLDGGMIPESLKGWLKS
jgi:alkylation response protein AidB-like acyl-CoA dehydrogenase